MPCGLIYVVAIATTTLLGLSDSQLVALYLLIGACAYFLSWYYQWRWIAPKAGRLAVRGSAAWWSSPAADPIIERVASTAATKVGPDLAQIVDERLAKAGLDQWLAFREDLTLALNKLHEEGEAARAQLEAAKETIVHSVNGALGKVVQQESMAADKLAATVADGMAAELEGQMPVGMRIKMRALKLAAAYENDPKATRAQQEAGALAREILGEFGRSGKLPEVLGGGSVSLVSRGSSGIDGREFRLGV